MHSMAKIHIIKRIHWGLFGQRSLAFELWCHKLCYATDVSPLLLDLKGVGRGPNKQGDWKIHQDEISRGGGRNFGINVQQSTTQIQNTLLYIARSKYCLELTQQKYQLFAGFS